MKYIQKKGWGLLGMIILTLVLNILIIFFSNKNEDLYWLLTLSIPLFIIAIYILWHKGQLFQKYFGRVLSSAQLTHTQSLSPSVYPTRIISPGLKVKIGNNQCLQPYNACILNVASMESVDEEGTFIDSSKKGEPQDSDNEILDISCLAAGGNIWQIDSCYKGCRTENGHFNSKVFKQIAHRPDIKMIELKLSSTNGIIYPVDPILRFSEPSANKMDSSLFSDSAFTTFSNAEGMIHFLGNLRELSGGKPVGIRISIKDKKDFYKICYAAQKAHIIPDFIVVEGSVETTSIVHSGQTLYCESSLYEPLLFVSQTLQTYGLKNKIRIIADGRITSCLDILKILALGADVIFTEMPNYRIIKNPENEAKLSLQFKGQNASDFHYDLMNDTVRIMKICGFSSVKDVTLSNFFSRLEVISSETLLEVNGPVVYPGSIKKAFNSIIPSPN